MYELYIMTDFMMFETRGYMNNGGESSLDNGSEPLVIGGTSVSSMLKKNKNILDVEGALFTRFNNLVVPIGLQLYPVGVDDDKDYIHENMDEHAIDSKRFDQLFYSVGKDLGISNSRTYKNRTMKNPTK
jgi:hypothetical protein